MNTYTTLVSKVSPNKENFIYEKPIIGVLLNLLYVILYYTIQLLIALRVLFLTISLLTYLLLKPKCINNIWWAFIKKMYPNEIRKCQIYGNKSSTKMVPNSNFTLYMVSAVQKVYVFYQFF